MKIEELVFINIENKIYPQKQLVHRFFVSERFIERGDIEVKPITFFNLIYSILRNNIRVWYWSLLRFLYKMGFIDIPTVDAFSWRQHFRFNFWSPKRYV